MPSGFRVLRNIKKVESVLGTVKLQFDLVAKVEKLLIDVIEGSKDLNRYLEGTDRSEPVPSPEAFVSADRSPLTWDEALEKYVEKDASSAPYSAIISQMAEMEQSETSEGSTISGVTRTELVLTGLTAWDHFDGSEDLFDRLSQYIDRLTLMSLTHKIDSAQENLSRDFGMIGIKDAGLAKRYATVTSIVKSLMSEVAPTQSKAMACWALHETVLASIATQIMMAATSPSDIPSEFLLNGRLDPSRIVDFQADCRSDEKRIIQRRRIINLIRAKLNAALSPSDNIWALRSNVGLDDVASIGEIYQLDFAAYKDALAEESYKQVFSSWDAYAEADSSRLPQTNIFRVNEIIGSARPSQADVDIIGLSGDTDLLLSQDIKQCLQLADILCMMAVPFLGPLPRAILGLLRAGIQVAMTTDDILVKARTISELAQEDQQARVQRHISAAQPNHTGGWGYVGLVSVHASIPGYDNFTTLTLV